MCIFMKKIVLVGNPNVGKSLIFSRITGIGVIVANYPGTTVELKTGQFKYQNSDYTLIDGPGIYTVDDSGRSKSDKIAMHLIDDSDIIINVIDATNLERNLDLTLQLLKTHKPMILCLNFWEETHHKGIFIDSDLLEKYLDLPVITTCALSSEGILNLVESLGRAKTSSLTLCKEQQTVDCNMSLHCAHPCNKKPDLNDRWKSIGFIISKVQRLTPRRHTILEHLNDFTLHPIGGIVSACVVLITTLAIVRVMGEGLINYLLDPFYSHFYAPFIQNLVNNIPSEIIKGLLIGSSLEPLQSFGILTSGVYIALVSVFPYFFSFYFVFGFLEDFGYLPRLAAVFDKIFHVMGLHGYSSIPVMLGLGCKVPAFMATRLLRNRREKILTISLILMSAPCLPQSAMIITLGMRHGITTVITIFFILLILAFGMNVLLNKFMKKGNPPDLFIELPPYRIPSIKLLSHKLWMRITEYFAEVLPMITVGVLILSMLDALGFTPFVTRAIERPVFLLFGLPPAIAPIMLLGFLRKDASIALLAPLNLSTHQFIITCIFLVLYIPCISSFFTLVKELGFRSTLKIMGIVFISTITITFFLHIFFKLIA